jgi:hypothetical protein
MMKVAVFVSLINYVRRFPFYLLDASLYFCLRINTSFNLNFKQNEKLQHNN